MPPKRVVASTEIPVTIPSLQGIGDMRLIGGQSVGIFREGERVGGGSLFPASINVLQEVSLLPGNHEDPGVDDLQGKQPLRLNDGVVIVVTSDECLRPAGLSALGSGADKGRVPVVEQRVCFWIREDVVVEKS